MTKGSTSSTSQIGSETERQLRELQTRYRLFVDSWAQAEWETDANGVVISDSPSWRAYTGQTLEGWLGTGWLNAIHPNDRTYAERQWREAIAARRVLDAQFRLRSPGGRWRWTNVRAAPELDATGNVEKWVAVNIDIDDRKRAEDALRESEEKFRTLFESIDEGFCVLEVLYDEEGEPQDCRYIQVNPAFLRQTGQQDPTGRLGSEYVPASAQTWLATYDAVVRSGDPVRFEQYHPDSGRWYSVYASIIGERGSHLVASAFTDVTERKRAEGALRESEERQAFLLKLSDMLRGLQTPEEVGSQAMGMLARELRLDRCWVCRFSREQGYAWLGPEYAPVGQPRMSGRYALRDFPETMKQVETASPAVDDVRNDPNLSELDRASILGLGMGAYMTTILRRGDQEYVWALCASTSEPRIWTDHDRTLLNDVTERVWAAMERARADVALRASEERFQQFANASASAIWIRDAVTLDMEYVSPAISSIYGVAPEVLLGDLKHWAAMIVPDDRETAIMHLGQASRGTPAVHEFRIHRPDDGFRWIRNTDFPLLDESGRVQRIGGIAEDVTEARMLAGHQDVLLHELQHRVRNIMSMVRSMGNRTADGWADVDDYRQRLEGRLLALARVQALLTRQANAGGSLGELIETEVHAQAHHAGQLQLTGPDLMLSPKAVEVLTLAFHELATNALKYGALAVQDGVVRVAWRTVDRDGRGWLSLDWEEQGAPARASSTRRGFGSELIEARIPYELGGVGKVMVGDGGARCHFEFPLDGAESILETDAPAPTTIFGGGLDMTGAPDLTGQRVLIVEDDYYAASDVAAAFRGAGAEVLGPCPNEELTRRLLEAETPTAAVVDLNLGGGGPKFVVAGLLRSKNVPFVFLTGYDPKVIPAEFASVKRLQKPTPFREVVDAVSELV